MEKKRHWKNGDKTVCGRKWFYRNGERNLVFAKVWMYVNCKNCQKIEAKNNR